jgi:hypothetical protein
MLELVNIKRMQFISFPFVRTTMTAIFPTHVQLVVGISVVYLPPTVTTFP